MKKIFTLLLASKGFSTYALSLLTTPIQPATNEDVNIADAALIEETNVFTLVQVNPSFPFNCV